MPDSVKGLLCINKNLTLVKPPGDLFCEVEKLVNSGFLAVEAILERVEVIVMHHI
jgi:hypothetical protein